MSCRRRTLARCTRQRNTLPYAENRAPSGRRQMPRIKTGAVRFTADARGTVAADAATTTCRRPGHAPGRRASPIPGRPSRRKRAEPAAGPEPRTEQPRPARDRPADAPGASAQRGTAARAGRPARGRGAGTAPGLPDAPEGGRRARCPAWRWTTSASTAIRRSRPSSARSAYTQGSDIHLGPGQEQHLPHEAWHVVQQKQGRVTATTQMKGSARSTTTRGLEARGRPDAARRSGQQARSVGRPEVPNVADGQDGGSSDRKLISIVEPAPCEESRTKASEPSASCIKAERRVYATSSDFPDSWIRPRYT